MNIEKVLAVQTKPYALFCACPDCDLWVEADTEEEVQRLWNQTNHFRSVEAIDPIHIPDSQERN